MFVEPLSRFTTAPYLLFMIVNFALLLIWWWRGTCCQKVIVQNRMRGFSAQIGFCPERRKEVACFDVSREEGQVRDRLS